jgi:hypothetical protein
MLHLIFGTYYNRKQDVCATFSYLLFASASLEDVLPPLNINHTTIANSPMGPGKAIILEINSG